jgi:hypothetical protein
MQFVCNFEHSQVFPLNSGKHSHSPQLQNPLPPHSSPSKLQKKIKKGHQQRHCHSNLQWTQVTLAIFSFIVLIACALAAKTFSAIRAHWKMFCFIGNGCWLTTLVVKLFAARILLQVALASVDSRI